MLLALFQGLLADALEIVDVEEAGPVAVVDARVEVARHGDVEDHHRAALASRQDVVEAAARHDRLRRTGSAQDNVGLDERLVELLPRHRPAAAT